MEESTNTELGDCATMDEKSKANNPLTLELDAGASSSKICVQNIAENNKDKLSVALEAIVESNATIERHTVVVEDKAEGEAKEILSDEVTATAGDEIAGEEKETTKSVGDVSTSMENEATEIADDECASKEKEKTKGASAVSSIIEKKVTEIVADVEKESSENDSGRKEAAENKGEVNALVEMEANDGNGKEKINEADKTSKYIDNSNEADLQKEKESAEATILLKANTDAGEQEIEPMDITEAVEEAKIVNKEQSDQDITVPEKVASEDNQKTADESMGITECEEKTEIVNKDASPKDALVQEFEPMDIDESEIVSKDESAQDIKVPEKDASENTYKVGDDVAVGKDTEEQDLTKEPIPTTNPETTLEKEDTVSKEDTEDKYGPVDIAEEIPESGIVSMANTAESHEVVAKQVAVDMEETSTEQATTKVTEDSKSKDAESIKPAVEATDILEQQPTKTTDIPEQQQTNTAPELPEVLTDAAEVSHATLPVQESEASLEATKKSEDAEEASLLNDAKDTLSEILSMAEALEAHKDVSDDADANDSEESKLIIDETKIAKDDEKDSCEDTSEVSVLTQVDVSELPSDLKAATASSSRKTSADDIPANGKVTSLNVIEIEDDEVEATTTATTATGDKQNVENIPQIIEIDDDDDDATPTTNVGTQNTAQLANNKSTTTDVKGQPIEDVEMTDISATPETEANNTEKSKGEVLSETQQPKEQISETAETTGIIEKSAEDFAPKEDIDDCHDVFYNRECINYMCSNKHKQYYRATVFVMNYYQVKKKPRQQYICAVCYDKAVEAYEAYGSVLAAKRPLYIEDFKKQLPQFVEIIDSSDEEDDPEHEKPKPLSKFTRDLIEEELNNSIKFALARVDIQTQLTWTKTILNTRLDLIESQNEQINTDLRALQKKADGMYNSLYSCPKVELRQLPELEMNMNSDLPVVSNIKTPNQPSEFEKYRIIPSGEVRRPPIVINETYYAVKNKVIASWVPCKVIEQVEVTVGIQKNVKQYRIKFLKSQYQLMKIVSSKHLAYYNAPTVRLPIGTRVIAWFDASSLSRNKEKVFVQSAFYPGIVAEPLKPNNNYRYLIFYDDGYTQYVKHQDVRLVCQVSENVWEDVHPASREFIQKYLTQYSINRPMVQTQKGQSMTTESNGKWIYARVVDIDCSLIQMQFEGPKSHTEWIYRGSLRLGPVFKEYQKSLQKDSLPISRVQRRTEPFIRYTEDEEPVTQQKQSQQQTDIEKQTAKKSVSRPTASVQQQQFSTAPTVRHLNNSTIYLEDENKPKGKVVYYTAKRHIPPRVYKPHKCSNACLHKITHNLSAYSPLSKPLLSGWERLLCRQKNKKFIEYRGPCGKIMRDMSELHKYLRLTENVLNVDNFDFCPDTNCLAEYVIETPIVQKRDISNGQEKMVIPLVNYYDHTFPPECKYAAQRIPTEGVNINLDEDFFVGCDCEDDCSDKAKCSCWQLTYEGAKYGNPNTPLEEIGYQYKRLQEHVPTGIYECNPRCKCKSNCLNRVVQESLQMKLQVFKTSNRGWGLRCINDVPKGSFICVYAGHLLTEAKANEGGLDAGDEYFAELDYIEVAEQIKEGYEEDVVPPEIPEEDTFSPERDDDDEFQPSKSVTRSKTRALTRSSARSSMTDDDSQERQVINFNPNADMNEESGRESSIRKLFGKDETCYIMDAKVTGNLGRYFNHSCSPNLFVQNVFVDTHDLRFPWVAFFAQTHIRAGTELTWNYNYEVGVVPGKVLYCQCGAPNCRLRLL